MLRQAAAADEQGNEMLAELDALKSARAEIAALRSAIQQVGCALTRTVAVKDTRNFCTRTWSLHTSAAVGCSLWFCRPDMHKEVAISAQNSHLVT